MALDHARSLIAGALDQPVDRIAADGDVETVPGWDSLGHVEIFSWRRKARSAACSSRKRSPPSAASPTSRAFSMARPDPGVQVRAINSRNNWPRQE